MKSDEWNAENLLRLSGSYWKTCALHAGVKLDLFTTLGKDRLSPAEIAEKLTLDIRGATMLLNALSGMKLLTHRSSRYANTPAGLSLLCKDSPDYLGYLILHHHYLMESWAHLDRAVKTGKPERSRSARGSKARRESFLMGMFNIAMKTAPPVVDAIDLANHRRLLDLGGGPGTYAVHFCLANPQLRATVYDLPETRPFAEKTFARFNLTDRIAFQAGDFLKDKIRGTYDVVLLSHILHAEGPKDCRKIVKKAISSLEAGGMIIIHEFILDNRMDRPLHPALFALNMLLGTPSGQAYSESQIMGMLAAARVREIRRLPLRTPNDSGLIVGFSS
jgi:predicted O-methyltransferase YrrM